MVTKITQTFIERIFHGSWHDETVLTGKSLEIMLEIRKTLNALAPIDGDGTRYFWFKVPKGMRKDQPTRWFYISTGGYKEYLYIKVSDRDHDVCIMSNEDRGNGRYENMTWFLEPFLEFIKEKVKKILKNPRAYNDYVENNLPYRQRTGSIKRSDLNRIFPQYKVEPQNLKRAIEVLHELLDRINYYESLDNNIEDKIHKTIDYKCVPLPFDNMSIRIFCKFYRIADEKFFHLNHDEKFDDIKYYEYRKFVDLQEYNLDSEDDFKRFANDHYGELGLSRMNVHATDYYVKGKWLITFGISYSAYIADGVEIAMALYDSGSPFVLYDADRLLAVLEERDDVLLTPNTFHDYLCHHKEGTVFSLPYEEYCGAEDEMTAEQYNEIVKLATWKPEIKVEINCTM